MMNTEHGVVMGFAPAGAMFQVDDIHYRDTAQVLLGIAIIGLTAFGT